MPTRSGRALLALATFAAVACAPPTVPGPSSSPVPDPGPWRPAVGVTWQWQLTGTVDTTVDAQVFDIDLFDNPKSVVDDLHARGRKVVCYVSVGSFEPWRPDAASFPDEVKGKPLGDFPDERWLDVRRTDVLGPIMANRFDQCVGKGFDAIEPDNVDGYTNDSGFPLTADDQLAFNRLMAKLAHDRGVSVALKNDLEQIPQLLAEFDFAVNEQCFEFDECGRLAPFIAAGKAVLHVEYNVATTAFCDRARAMRFSSMRKAIDLDASREPC